MISAKVKKIIHNYIENLDEILEYENNFNESLTFHLDENKEFINKVTIDFFEKESLPITLFKRKENSNSAKKIKFFF